MKSSKRTLRNLVLGLGALGIIAPAIFAENHLITISYPSDPPYRNGIIYSVPAGANYEWEVTPGAHILIGGGGLNVNASGGHYYDVGSTSYADSISYQLSAYSGGSALFWLGW